MKPWGVIIASFILSFTLTIEAAAAPLYIRETIKPTEIERDNGKLVPMRDLRMMDGLLKPKEPEPEPEPTPEPTPEPEPVATSYFGNCRITFYCPCSQCCGSWGNATASGAMPTAGWTVANGSLPFGTQVIIDGHTYCVEDRGVGGDQFDIFVNDHGEALARGLYYTDVYLVG